MGGGRAPGAERGLHLRTGLDWIYPRQHRAGPLRRAAGASHVGALAQADLRRRHRGAGSQDAGRAGVARMHQTIDRLLVANRGEIAIRVMRAAHELAIRTVAIFSQEDRGARHRFTGDESYLVGAGRTPIGAYLDVDDIVRIARQARVDAVHPGYGFLAESPEFAAACARAGIVFIGPQPQAMRTLGNKIAARALALAVGVPILPATGPLPRALEQVRSLAAGVGFPPLGQAQWGGGRGGEAGGERGTGVPAPLGAAAPQTGAALG